MNRILQNVRVIELGIANANVNFRDLNLAVAALAQENARSRIEAAAVAALTDSSGGTKDDTDFILTSGSFPALFTADGTTLCAPKTAFDTAVAAILAGQQEIGAKLATALTAVGSPRSLKSLAGTNDGTIAAVTTALTGTATTTCVEGVSARTQLSTLRNNMSAIAAGVNYVAIAMGLAPLTDDSGGSFQTNDGQASADKNSFITAATAATGAAVTTGANSLKNTEAVAYLGVLVNNLATIVAKLNALLKTDASTGGPLVIATSSAFTRFVSGDVTFAATA